MKERLALALSWYAFLNAAIIVPAIILAVGGEKDFGRAYLHLYEDIFGRELGAFVALCAPPAIWHFLWITTGKFHFLPWRG